MNEFPRMLYRAGGADEIHGGRFATFIVHNVDELDAALAAGWFMTTLEATEATKPKAESTIPDDSATPTRDELKRKANEMGLQYQGNISNANLAALIDAALTEKAKG